MDLPNEVPIGRLVGIAGRLVAGRVQRVLDNEGITHAGWMVVFRLATTDGMTVREIADACYVRPATMTGLVDTLEREGLVRRERGGADRRQVRVYITDEGRARFASTKARIEAAMRPVFGDVSPREEAVVRRFLLRTIDRIGLDAEPATEEAP